MSFDIIQQENVTVPWGILLFSSFGPSFAIENQAVWPSTEAEICYKRSNLYQDSSQQSQKSVKHH